MPAVTWQLPHRSRTIGNTSSLYVYLEVIALCASPCWTPSAMAVTMMAQTQTRRTRVVVTIMMASRSRLRKRRLDIVGRLDELRIRLGDLLLVADVAERIEQPGGAHELRERGFHEPAPCLRQLVLVCLERERQVLRLEGRHVDARERAAVDELANLIGPGPELREHLRHGVGNRQRHERRVDAGRPFRPAGDGGRRGHSRCTS